MPESPDTQIRLIRCFQAVFPELSEGDAIRATADRISKWDSLATVNLAAVVEEEFGIRFAPQEIERLTSFNRYLDRLN